MTLIAPDQGVVTDLGVGVLRRRLPSFLDAYRRYTENQEASDKIHMWTGLSILAGALGRKVWYTRGHYSVYPNLYVLIIGAPGLVHKSTATAIGVDLLRKLRNFPVMAEKVTDAAIVQAMKRSATRFLHGSRELKQSAVYCYASELAVFMKQMESSGMVTELLTTFYDCQPNDSSVPWVKETKSDGIAKIYGPCLNLLGCSTPNWLRRCIPVDEMEGGFASRVIFVVEADASSRSIPIPTANALSGALRQDLLNDLACVQALVGEVNQTEEAKEAFTGLYERNRRIIADRGMDARFSGYYGRKMLMVEKVALLLSVSESDTLTVTDAHIIAAHALLEAMEKDMFRLFEGVGTNPHAALLGRLKDFVRRYERVNGKTLHRTFYTSATLDDLSKAISQLVSAGIFQQISSGNAVYYKLTPSALQEYETGYVVRNMGEWDGDLASPEENGHSNGSGSEALHEPQPDQPQLVPPEPITH